MTEKEWRISLLDILSLLAQGLLQNAEEEIELLARRLNNEGVGEL